MNSIVLFASSTPRQHRAHLRRSFLVLVLVFTATSTARAAPGDYVRTILNPNRQFGGVFGVALATDGTRLIIGASGNRVEAEPSPVQSGNVYTFNPLTGAQLRTFGAASPQNGDNFGAAVASVGQNILVGASDRSQGADRAGAAFLFDGNSGILRWSTNNPTPATLDRFGSAVGAYQNQVFVAAPWDDTGGVDTGAVYRFDAQTGSMMATISNPTPTAQSLFGSTIVVADNDLFIGSPAASVVPAVPGAVHRFDARNGNLIRTFAQPNDQAHHFGFGIAVVGDRLFIGAPLDASHEYRSGAVYVHDLSTGNLMWRLHSPNPAAAENYGLTLIPYGRNVLVTDPVQTGINSTGGAVYLHDGRNGALLHAFLPPPDSADQFGTDVVVVGNQIAIGEPTHLSSTNNRIGAVHLYEGFGAIGAAAHTTFDEPNIGAANYTPAATAVELGFRTTSTSTGGRDPLAATASEPVFSNARVLSHRSVAATTTFDPADLSLWRDVELVVAVQISDTGYENGDFLRITAAHGAETLTVFDASGLDGAGNDPLEALAGLGFREFRMGLPAAWTSATLAVSSFSNSGVGAERFDIDQIRMIGVPIPEPSSEMLLLLAVVLLVGRRCIYRMPKFRY
jgi:hypothetical protein